MKRERRFLFVFGCVCVVGGEEQNKEILRERDKEGINGFKKDVKWTK